MDGKELRCSELDRLRAELHEWKQRAHEAERNAPVDADGVPVHIGDKLYWDGHVGTITVTGIQIGDGTPWEIWDKEIGCWRTLDSMHHVEPRTIEDVRCEMIHEYGCSDDLAETIAAKYADEIRELMGGDA